ncbi:MAG: UDP-N-acetylmuramate dehydrogenase [Arenicellales bacterium]
MHGIIHRSLESHLDGIEGHILRDEPMDKHTSWRVGGAADLFFIPQDKVSLVQLMCQLPGNVPVYWIGLGSNLLVRDAGVEGMVICTLKGLGVLEQVKADTVYAQAGVTSAKVAKFCARHGLEGAEFLAGIPGSFGGAVAMNAGAYDGDTWSLITRIECLDRDGNLSWFNKSEIEYQYRHVNLPKQNWIVGAEIKLKPIKGLDLLRRIRELLKTRAASQPVQSANAGSVFKNPKNEYAAKLLDEAGMKGQSVGGAEFSEKHANFIINKGEASAADIEYLMQLGQAEVFKQSGIQLEPEVRIIGRSESEVQHA